uniref:Thyroglobulin type-1 domain-containing protein n=1 Tax=Stegastes partitus TaxID=144197 RepID=A0A3B5B916_9TELE
MSCCRKAKFVEPVRRVSTGLSAASPDLFQPNITFGKAQEMSLNVFLRRRSEVSGRRQWRLVLAAVRNGRLYKSLCSFQRAQCINTQLRLCQLARAQAVEARGLSSSSSFGPAAAIFVPECSSEGHFLPTQCHNQTGYCWCSTPDGKPLSGTTVLHQVPDCSGQTSVTATTTTTTYTTNTTITTTTTTSSTITTTTTDERFIPECTADGRYSSVQCHAATGYCWCVRADSGRPLPGTSMLVHGVCSPSTGCPGARKKQFLKTSDSPPSTSPSSDPPPSPSSSPLGASAAPEAEDSSGPEAVLRWHFGQLDVDSSGVLSEREARPLRQFLRRRLKPRRCAKKFAQYCDRDGDRGLTIEELRHGGHTQHAAGLYIVVKM